MDEEERTDRIMTRMGFPATETGPYVRELRKEIRRQVGEGMTYRSAGTWGPEAATMTAEERARHVLAFDWEWRNGHGQRVELLDGVRSVKDALPWARDQMRSLAMKWRVLRDKKILGKKNPYL